MTDKQYGPVKNLSSKRQNRLTVGVRVSPRSLWVGLGTQPVVFQSLALEEPLATQRQKAFCTVGVPELVRSLHSLFHLFHRALNGA